MFVSALFRACAHRMSWRETFLSRSLRAYAHRMSWRETCLSRSLSGLRPSNVAEKDMSLSLAGGAVAPPGYRSPKKYSLSGVVSSGYCGYSFPRRPTGAIAGQRKKYSADPLFICHILLWIVEIIYSVTMLRYGNMDCGTGVCSYRVEKPLIRR